MSSIKRDLGMKDMAALIPGHGGLLDRFDSILFVGPALFHYINYFHGVGLDQPARVFSGG
jgi:phosphatidate cytidylyltransferase